jgi:hypothetical protein
MVTNAIANVKTTVKLAKEQATIQDVLKVKKVAFTTVVNSASVVHKSLMKESVADASSINYRASSDALLAPVLEFVDGINSVVTIDKAFNGSTDVQFGRAPRRSKPSANFPGTLYAMMLSDDMTMDLDTVVEYMR